LRSGGEKGRPLSIEKVGGEANCLGQEAWERKGMRTAPARRRRGKLILRKKIIIPGQDKESCEKKKLLTPPGVRGSSRSFYRGENEGKQDT